MHSSDYTLSAYGTIFGSSVVESINNYAQVQNMLINASMGVSEKYGSSLGFRGANNDRPGNEYFDGRICPANDAGFLSFPLKNSLIPNCTKLLPMSMCSAIRVQFTLDSLTNVFMGTTAEVVVDTNSSIQAQPALIQPTSFTLSDVQLCYRTVDFGAETDQMRKNFH
jgi:hypothetical protein